MSLDLTLISHDLCPYVQRAAISLSEKQAPYQRRYVDLRNKPDWFLKLSPLAKTPVLVVDEHAIFESSVILEFLEDTVEPAMHPTAPLAKAENRSWIEFGSSVLSDIAAFYSAKEADAMDAKKDAITRKFTLLEAKLGSGPWYNGENFSLVDAAFGPVFRYFDVFDTISDFGFFAETPRVSQWRCHLAQRPSIINAVSDDYESKLLDFLVARNSRISEMVAKAIPASRSA